MKTCCRKNHSRSHCFWPRIIESPEVDVFQGQLAGQTIEGIERRGKFLIFKLSDNDMISHLRMEGKYEFHQADDEIAKHTHVMFTLQMARNYVI